MNQNNLNYHSIKTLKIIFANLFRNVLFFEFFIFALNIELIKRTQSEIVQVTFNDVKNCINEFVNEIEAKRALIFDDQKQKK